MSTTAGTSSVNTVFEEDFTHQDAKHENWRRRDGEYIETHLIRNYFFVKQNYPELLPVLVPKNV